MSKTISATLVADGLSDHNILIPLITILLDELSPWPFRIESAVNLADGSSLRARLPQAVRKFPCDLLFVHRDAEGQLGAVRRQEIQQAIADAGISVPHVCVVPVRMTEAWLLVDESAIRLAVGNAEGRAPLNLPLLHRVEAVDAKDVLFSALEAAKDLGARRARRFRPEQHRHRVAEALSSVEPLRALPSFQDFEAALGQLLARWT